MSLHTGPNKILLNELDTDTVVADATSLTIKGLPTILLENIKSCYKLCPTSCTARVIRLTPTVPSAPCECPYEWSMTIARKVCYHGRTDNDVKHEEFYSVALPSGATPTVNDIVEQLLEQINKNPYSVVTAAGVGSPGSYTAIDLTEKDCDSDTRSCGFSVGVESGSYTQTTAHVSAQLTADDTLRIWGIQPDSFGERRNVALCGTYCVFVIDVDPSGTTRDQNFDNAYVQRKMTVEVWVNADLANYDTDFADELAATGLPCFQ